MSSAFRETSSGPGFVNVTSTTQEIRGARLSLLGAVPLGEAFSLLGSVSAYRLKGDQREVDTLTLSPPAVTTPAVTTTGERSTSGSGTVAGLGIGAAYRSGAIEFRAMLDWTQGKDDFFGAGQDLDSIRMTSFSIGYTF